MTTTQGVRPAAAKRRYRLLAAYLAIQVVLVAASFALPMRAGGVVDVTIVLFGILALSACVVRRNPPARFAWWLVAASAWLTVLLALLVAATYGLRRDATISALLPLIVSSLPYPVLAVGLAWLARIGPRRGPADVLDATMTALAAFLLLWALILDPTVTVSASSVTTATVFPIEALLVATLAVRLMLAGGLADPAISILMVGVVALIATTVSVVAPALGRPELQAGDISNTLFLVYGVAFGAAGTMLSSGEVRYRARPDPGDTSTHRLVLFVVLALVPPAAWAIQLSRAHNADVHHVAVWVPLIVSAVFLLLLVVRLNLIARVASRRASELAQRSAALAQSVADQADLQRQLTFRAWHDPLTGLLNRDVLAEHVSDALRRDGSSRHALLLLDLDGFKDVNDTLGHPVGDDLLVQVARRLVGAVPPGATLARLGGDEFAVLLEDTDPAAAAERAAELLDALRAPYAMGERELFLTTSIGVLITDPAEPAPTPSDALRDADLALYAAKDAGKNRVAVFEPGLRDARRDHARINSGLRYALSHDEFVLHYQPVVDLGSGATVAVEALVRWLVPGSGLVPPASFIPVAEDTGLINEIGGWVLRQACHDARPWYGEHGVAVSVNVSGRQFDDPDFGDQVLATLDEAGLPGRALILEITETSLVQTSQVQDTQRQLHLLRSHGIRMAIDDFGTGYSSLSYVASLPIDIVKVDKAFATGRTGWAFTEAILRLVASLDKVAVVEGVETVEQATALRELGCPLVQGFHFSRPQPATSISAALAHAPANPSLAGRV